MKKYALIVLGVLAFASPTFAQVPSPGTTATKKAAAQGFWIDVNFIGINAAQNERSYAWPQPSTGEPPTFAATYPALPAAFGLGVAGGYQIRYGLGVAVHYTTGRYQNAGDITVTIPSPAFFETYGGTSGTIRAIERTDHALDMSLTYTLSTPGAWRVRIFGGPTYFAVSHEMESSITFSPSIGNFIPWNTGDMMSNNSRTVTESTWGLHAGADVSYFFSRHVGLGGVIQVNGGSISFDGPVGGNMTTFKVGGVTTGAGLRIRF